MIAPDQTVTSHKIQDGKVTYGIKSEQNKVDFMKKDEIDEGLIKEYEQRNTRDRKYNLRSRTKMYSLYSQE